MLPQPDNVLRNQLLIDQSNALQQRNRGNALNALAQSVQSYADAPRRNALMDAQVDQAQGQARVAKVQGLQAEARIVVPFISGIEQAADPAAAYDEAVRAIEAAGVDIAEQFERYTPENLKIVKTIYTLPPAQLTDLERILAGLGSDAERLQFLQIKAGLKADANTRMRAETSGFNLGPGQTRFDTAGNPIARVAPKPQGAPSGYRISADGRGFEAIPGGPADPSVIQQNAQARGPATQITIGDGQHLPKPPTGTVWQMGPDGRPVLDERGAPIAIPFQGGPAMADAAAAETQAQGRRNQAIREATVVTEDISRAVGIIQNSDWPTTGLFGAALANLPGSAAHDLNKMMDTIKSNSAFGALQKMRENSPTGGALGAVSERELTLLQSTIGSLEQSQGQQQILDNLARVHNGFLDVVFGAGEGPQRMPVTFRQGDVQRRLEFLRAQYPNDADKVMQIMRSEGLL